MTSVNDLTDVHVHVHVHVHVYVDGASIDEAALKHVGPLVHREILMKTRQLKLPPST
jgi:hypothetical protein